MMRVMCGWPFLRGPVQTTPNNGPLFPAASVNCDCVCALLLPPRVCDCSHELCAVSELCFEAVRTHLRSPQSLLKLVNPVEAH